MPNVSSPKKKKATVPQVEIEARAAEFTAQLGRTRFASRFTPESIRLAASLLYPSDAERLESRFCRYIEKLGDGNPDFSFGDLVQFASARDDRERAVVLLVASNLNILY